MSNNTPNLNPFAPGDRQSTIASNQNQPGTSPSKIKSLNEVLRGGQNPRGQQPVPIQEPVSQVPMGISKKQKTPSPQNAQLGGQAANPYFTQAPPQNYGPGITPSGQDVQQTYMPTGNQQQFKKKRQSAKPSPSPNRNQMTSHYSKDSLGSGYSTQSNKKTPEQIKDFNAAYRQMVEKVFNEQGAQLTGLITEEELADLDRHKQLNEKEFLARVEDFQRRKEARIRAKQEEKMYEGDEDCTFTPYLEASQMNPEGDEDRVMTAHDMKRFMQAQERYEEQKQLNSQRIVQEMAFQDDAEHTGRPEIDDLSKQITDMMEERKAEPCYNRLYKIGKDKLRNKTTKAAEKVASQTSLGKEAFSTASKQHRGKPTQVALYELHQELQRKQELRRQQIVHQEAEQKQLEKFRNPESNEIRIQGFKKEFRQVLYRLVTPIEEQRAQMEALRAGRVKKNSDMAAYSNDPQFGQANPKQHILKYPMVEAAMREMGFVSPAMSQEEEMQVDDLYTLFKCHKDQNILAENLQNTLMLISGLRDETKEIENDTGNSKWMMAGVYEQETGLFFFRQGEHMPVQSHFSLLNTNRMYHRKSSTQSRRMQDENTFEPQILEKSKYLAEKHRSKYLSHDISVDVVQILLNPELQRAKQEKLENLRREIDAKENAELTLRPKTNHRKNAYYEGDQQWTSGDHNIDLYEKARLRERAEQMNSLDRREQEDLKECRFYPQVNDEIYQDMSDGAYQSVHEIKGTDKVVERMRKARQQAEFKKKMTERSEFSATVGVKKAKKMIKKGASQGSAGNMVLSLSKTKQTSFGKVDGSQMNPPRKPIVKTSAKGRLPLYFPKQEPVVPQPEKTRSLKRKTSQKPSKNSDPVRAYPPHPRSNSYENGILNDHSSGKRKPKKAASKSQPRQEKAQQAAFRDQSPFGEDEEPHNIKIDTDQPLNAPVGEGQAESPEVDPRKTQDPRGEPKLYVDINIGKPQMERIVVFEGDTAEELARDFCSKNDLNSDMEEKLRIQLSAQIAGVLPKIVESDDESDNGQKKGKSPVKQAFVAEDRAVELAASGGAASPADGHESPVEEKYLLQE